MSSYNRKDRFFQKAKKDQFVARSIYKLEEIDRRHRLFAKGQRIVDLGCSPGSWLQFLETTVGPKGFIIGYDLERPRVASGPTVVTFEADVYTLTPERIRADAAKPLHTSAEGLVFHGLVSDMAPKLSGIRDADQARSVGLAEQALVLAEALVAEGGFFVAKCFQGRDIDALVARVKESFSDVRLLKPEATREGSREVFVIGQKRRALVSPEAP
ncbi:RlmE family RNA methyltransferase [Myxococcota bacterium]|nr:RlmE family RNA methyltransferase [Myxococcota bacterium]